MAISKSKNKRNLAKRKLRKEKELNFIKNNKVIAITALTNIYEERLKQALAMNGTSLTNTEHGGIYKLIKENSDDISRIN